MKKALILDFGGVITRTLFETHTETEAALGLAPGTLTWYGPFDPETDSLWQEMQAGEITERDYWRTRAREVGQLVGFDWHEMSDFVNAARGSQPNLVIRSEFLETITIAQKNQIKLAILSNELDLFYGTNFRNKLSFMSEFHVILDATHTHILKPDEQAYEMCLNNLNLSPDECVFVDDQLKNIAGAENFGLSVVHFDVTNPRRSYDEALEKLGLEERLAYDGR